MILTNGLYLLSLVLQSQLTIYDLGPEYEGNNREVHVENDDIENGAFYEILSAGKGEQVD